MVTTKNAVKDAAKKSIASNSREKYEELLRTAKEYGPVMKTATLIGLTALLGVEVATIGAVAWLAKATLGKMTDTMRGNSKRLKKLRRE